MATGSSSNSRTLGITIERNVCESRLSELNVNHWHKWACTAGIWQFKYDAEYTCYLSRGKVKAYQKGSSEFVEFGAGDLVTIPKGLSLTRDISVGLNKRYKFEPSTP